MPVIGYIQRRNWTVQLVQSDLSLDNGLETPVLLSSNTVTLTLTSREFVEFLSSIELGAEIAYPDKKHELTNRFIQALS